jgi:phospholipase/carboxylesterase
MNDLIIQQPDRTRAPDQGLILLFHGVGSSAADLRPLGASLAAQHPQDWVVSVQSPEPSDLGAGWQWFSVRGVTEDNRAYRVATAMPGFVDAVSRWQAQSGVGPGNTTLVGFSQGAIMALEATQIDVRLARRVAAMAGRFAATPQRAPHDSVVHLLHGQADGVVPAQGSIQAHAQLTGLGAQVTLDLFPGLGHGIDARMLAKLHERLAGAD